MRAGAATVVKTNDDDDDDNSPFDSRMTTTSAQGTTSSSIYGSSLLVLTKFNKLSESFSRVCATLLLVDVIVGCFASARIAFKKKKYVRLPVLWKRQSKLDFFSHSRDYLKKILGNWTNPDKFRSFFKTFFSINMKTHTSCYWKGVRRITWDYESDLPLCYIEKAMGALLTSKQGQ